MCVRGTNFYKNDLHDKTFRLSLLGLSARPMIRVQEGAENCINKIF